MVARDELAGKADSDLRVVFHSGAICLALGVCAALFVMEGGDGWLAQPSRWAGGRVSVALAVHQDSSRGQHPCRDLPSCEWTPLAAGRVFVRMGWVAPSPQREK